MPRDLHELLLHAKLFIITLCHYFMRHKTDLSIVYFIQELLCVYVGGCACVCVCVCVCVRAYGVCARARVCKIYLYDTENNLNFIVYTIFRTVYTNLLVY